MGWENDLFAWGDPLHDKLDPLDAWLQKQIVGDEQTQAQVMPELGNTAVDVVGYMFGYPGAGSLLRASNYASDGNWTGAAINGALGAYGASGWGGAAGSAGSTAGGTASAPAEGGLLASQPVEGTTAIGSTGGQATTAGTDYSSAFGPQSAANDYGGSGLSSISGSPQSTQFMTGNINDVASVGGAGQSLGTTVAQSSDLAKAGLLGSSVPWGDLAKYGMKGYQTISQGQAQAEQRKQAAMQQAHPQMAPMMSPDPQRGPVASFGQISPYSSFQGGFNPRRYAKRGLLG